MSRLPAPQDGCVWLAMNVPEEGVIEVMYKWPPSGYCLSSRDLGARLGCGGRAAWACLHLRWPRWAAVLCWLGGGGGGPWVGARVGVRWGPPVISCCGAAQLGRRLVLSANWPVVFGLLGLGRGDAAGSWGPGRRLIRAGRGLMKYPVLHWPFLVICLRPCDTVLREFLDSGADSSDLMIEMVA
ncbi:hypothetical protein NDU88_005866 [Pleurodeles waltl]|uniref:Uncharacterized protein n=1 Tax=Pleurodeles waltl TaxID=8319 RepID=A0AAV7VL61_PLEWA|nr:hypothetical protein NDU88_005866 [Pleurodeles waltl]